jgi:hypothetical protein
MQKKKNLPTQEPLLSAVARRLGRAAGTLAKITHRATGSLSSAAGATASRASKPAPKEKSDSSSRGRYQSPRTLAVRKTARQKPIKKRASRPNRKQGTSS